MQCKTLNMWPFETKLPLYENIILPGHNLLARLTILEMAEKDLYCHTKVKGRIPPFAQLVNIYSHEQN